MKKTLVKILAAFLALTMLIPFAGCQNDTPKKPNSGIEETDDKDKTKETEKEVAPDETKEGTVVKELTVESIYTAKSPTEPGQFDARYVSDKLTKAGKASVERAKKHFFNMVAEEALLTYEMMIPSQLSYGNSARVAEVMRRSINGEKVTIGLLGDSIPAGAGASETSKTLGGQIIDFWNDSFHPEGKEGNAEFVNASIGSNSLLNVCHRMDDDLLSHNPDLVVMTAWSTHDAVYDKAAFESMIARMLDKGIAVIVCIVCDSMGKNNTVLFKEIAEGYSVPFVSWAEAFKKNELMWSEFGSDSIHPNDRGHASIAASVCLYLLSVAENLPEISKKEAEMPAEEITKYGRLFTTATVYDRNDADKYTVENNGFSDKDYAASAFRTYNGWHSANKGDTIVFTVTGIKSIMILFGHDTDLGRVTYSFQDVETGKRLGGATIDNNASYSYTWNTGVARGLEGKTVKVTVKAVEGTVICGLMVTPE